MQFGLFLGLGYNVVQGHPTVTEEIEFYTRNNMPFHVANGDDLHVRSE